MPELTHTFGANGQTFLYNAVDTKIYRIHSAGDVLAAPTTAEFTLDIPAAEIRARLARGATLLMLNVTQQCNLRCTYCAYSGRYPYERTHGDARMTRALAQRAIDLFVSHTSDQDEAYISFYGGEPLMAFDLIQQCVQYVREAYPARCFRLALTTNATLLTPSVAQFLVRERFHIAVSLNGPAPVHDASRVFPAQQGTWDIVMQRLQALHDLAPEYFRTHVSLIAVMVDRRRIAAMHDFYAAHPLVRDQALIVNAANPYDADPDMLKPLTPDEQATYDAYLTQLEQQYIDDVLNHPEAVDAFAEGLFGSAVARVFQRDTGPLPATYLPAAVCVPGAQKLFVSSTGVLHACEKMGEGLPLGDLERGLDEEACVRLMQDFIALNRADCERCWVIRFCPVCLVMARQGNELSLARRRAWCETVLQQFDRALRMYVSVAERDSSAWMRYHAVQRTNPLQRWLE